MFYVFLFVHIMRMTNKKISFGNNFLKYTYIQLKRTREEGEKHLKYDEEV